MGNLEAGGINRTGWVVGQLELEGGLWPLGRGG